MPRYKVKKGSHYDIFDDLLRAKQKRDNKWNGNAEIYKEIDGIWVLMENV